jgi:tRNA threonylcarbamoyladenosine biosynthesis protein TsaB
MDTSHVFLALGIIQDNAVIASFQEPCWKKQSEMIFPQLIGMMDSKGLRPEDIDSIVISSGPGSYTGVRIAMTIAKVFCSMRNVPLYTVPTLLLYGGREDCRVVLDARGRRCYTARCRDGHMIGQQQVLSNAEIPQDAPAVIGDQHLFNKEDRWPDLIQNFLALKDEWKPAENVHLVTPDYLKDSDAYMVKK